MLKKRHVVLVTIVLGLASVAVISLAGCQGKVSFTTASLSEAAMCKSVDPETSTPAEKTDVFSPDTPEIYCSVKLSRAPSDTEVMAQWIYVQGEAKDLKDHKIAEYTLTSKDTGYLSFSLTRPTAGFPRGDYVVKLLVGGKEKLSVPFRVE